MEGEQPEQIDELLDELEEEYSAPELLPPEVGKLVRDLRSAPDSLARHHATNVLGKVETSDRRVVLALLAAREHDRSRLVREAAAKSLKAAPHQEILRRHPELEEQGVPELAPQVAPPAPGEPEEQTDLQAEVEELMRILRSSADHRSRRDAADDLGRIGMNHPQVPQALRSAMESDPSLVVRMAARRSLHRGVDMEKASQHARRAMPSRTKSRSPSYAVRPTRQVPQSGNLVLVIMVGGALILVAGIIFLFTRLNVCGLLSLAGVALLGWGAWIWKWPASRRNVYLRSMKETTGTVKGAAIRQHTDEYGNVYFRYYVTVWFDAETGEDEVRRVAVRARLKERIWSSVAVTESEVTVRYASEDPTIALIEGEW
jgi:hypothetical protein